MTRDELKTAHRQIDNLRGPICTPIAGPVEDEVLIAKSQAHRIVVMAECTGCKVIVHVASSPAFCHLIYLLKADDE